MLRVVLVSCFLLSSCVSKQSIVEKFVENARSLEIKPHQLDGEWRFNVSHPDEEFSYHFIGTFSNENFEYRTCLQFPIDSGWKILEISLLESKDSTSTNIAAAYHLDGSYLEIYLPSNLCDHVFEIFKSQVLDKAIVGYQTFDGAFWGWQTIVGDLNAHKVNSP